jgi:uncharacterized protein DUF5681
MANPTGKGGFKKGQSGNPGGRPKDPEGVHALARSFCPEAIDTLVQIMRDKGVSTAARVSASLALLERGYGKPAQTINSNIKRVDANNLSDAELVAYLTGDGGEDTAPSAGDSEKFH